MLTKSQTRRSLLLAGGGVVALSLAALSPVAAYAAPAPAPADPTLLFEETFEAGDAGSLVVGLAGYTGGQGASYSADPFWLDAAACNGLVLQSGADWTGPGAACATPASRTKLESLAQVLGGTDAANHVVAAYTDKNGPADETLLVRSVDSGIEVVKDRFYVASIDIGEVNCWASADSTISFGLVLPSGEVMIDGDPAVACNDGTQTGTGQDAINSGTFYSAGFKSTESGSAEYVARNLQTSGGGNDFAYDNLRFFDATPTLHKSFSTDAVEVGQPLTMELTVVNTSELSEKTGWGFTDNLPAGMTVADEPNVSSTCAAADVSADAGAGVVTIAGGSIADGVAGCAISVDVVLSDGGSFTNSISDVDGLDGEPSATVRALVPSMTLTKTVSPTTLTADNPTATYTFTVLNDGDVDLHDVAVSDAGPIGGKGTMGPIDCDGVTDVAVGDDLVCTAVYTVHQDDLTGTDLTNEAKATGVSPAGTQVGADSSADVTTVLPQPELTLVKSADTEIATKAGQVITYSFAVTNTGNVNVADVTVAEGEFSGAGEMGEIVCPADSELLVPAATVTCEAEYTVLAADLTGKALTNTATASGEGPFGPVVSNASSAEVKTAVPAGGLANTGGASMLPLGAAALTLLVLGGLAIVAAARRKQMS